MTRQEAILDQEILHYRSLAYAQSTRQTYTSFRDTYLRFCIYFGYTPVPADNLTIWRYTAFLSRSVSSVSIPGYLSVVRILHLEASLPNPIGDNWILDTILRGIKRDHPVSRVQKLPITPDILRLIHSHIDLSSPIDVAFWSACLIAFFGFLRKSSLLPKSRDITSAPVLSRKDVSFSDSGALLSIRHTKTIQFCERILQIPIIRISNSILCPVTALEKLMSLSLGKQIPDVAPLFSYPVSDYQHDWITHSVFVSKLRSVLSSCGLQASKFSGHSFRRGGATFAFTCGVPAELIKMHGDWRSSAYLRYISPSLTDRQKLSRIISLHI